MEASEPRSHGNLVLLSRLTEQLLHKPTRPEGELEDTVSSPGSAICKDNQSSCAFDTIKNDGKMLCKT
ncbi:hypothetical protein STEG23_021569 [Scotinomys teguina]